MSTKDIKNACKKKKNFLIGGELQFHEEFGKFKECTFHPLESFPTLNPHLLLPLERDVKATFQLRRRLWVDENRYSVKFYYFFISVVFCQILSRLLNFLLGSKLGGGGGGHSTTHPLGERCSTTEGERERDLKPANSMKFQLEHPRSQSAVHANSLNGESGRHSLSLVFVCFRAIYAHKRIALHNRQNHGPPTPLRG